MSFSSYMNGLVLNRLFDKSALHWQYIEVALSRSDPVYGLNEPVGNNYSRQLTGAATWGTTSGNILYNTQAITFPMSTGDWGTITYFALMGEDVYLWSGVIGSGLLTPSRAIDQNYVASFAASALSIKLNGIGQPGSFGNYLESLMLNHIFWKSSFNIATIYIGLCTDDPRETGTGSNCSELPNTAGYARVATTNINWSYAGVGLTLNETELVFPEATADWGTITHFVMLDSGTYGGGNLLAYGELTQPVHANEGSRLRFNFGDLEVSIT